MPRSQKPEHKKTHHKTATTASVPSMEIEYTEPENVHFPCVECKGPLPVKHLEDGKVIKRWDDNVCGACWAAGDILDHPEKYRFTDEIRYFIEQLELDDLRMLFFHQESTPWADLISDLYVIMHNHSRLETAPLVSMDGAERDPILLFDQLRQLLAPIKCHKFYLAMQLHRKTTNYKA